MSFLFHAPKDPTPQLQAQIQPLIAQEGKQSAAGYTAGTGDVGTARQGLVQTSDYFSQLMNGSPDQLLKLFQPEQATKQIDENAQQLGDLGVRGGARAGILGDTSFTRDADFNRILAGLRAAAPSQLAQVAQTIGNLGLGEESAAQGAGAQASQNIFGVANVGVQQQQAYYGLIGSIFEAGGSALGAYLGCVTEDTLITMEDGSRKFIKDIEIGDSVLSFDIDLPTYRKVVRIRDTYCEDPVKTKFKTGEELKSSKDHECVSFMEGVMVVEKLVPDEFCLGTAGEVLVNKQVEEQEKYYPSSLYIVKLQDEEFNYSFVTNGILSMDDYCLGV